MIQNIESGYNSEEMESLLSEERMVHAIHYQGRNYRKICANGLMALGYICQIAMIYTNAEMYANPDSLKLTLRGHLVSLAPGIMGTLMMGIAMKIDPEPGNNRRNADWDL